MINHFDHGVTLPKITRKTTKNGRRYFTPEGKAYPSITEQLDMQYHDKKDGTTTWEDAIQAVKDANPKA